MTNIDFSNVSSIIDEAERKEVIRISDSDNNSLWLRKYNVTLNKNGGSCTDLTSYLYSIGATLPTDAIRNGYTFDGWFDNSELTGSSITAINAEAIGDKSFYAKWKVATESIEINVESGTASCGNSATYTTSITNGHLYFTGTGCAGGGAISYGNINGVIVGIPGIYPDGATPVSYTDLDCGTITNGEFTVQAFPCLLSGRGAEWHITNISGTVKVVES